MQIMDGEELNARRGTGKLRIYPDPILRKKALPVKNIDGKVKELGDLMVETMVANKGIGLAAPQIGILSQLIVLGLGSDWQVLINPDIVEAEGESLLEEGCLSLPTLEVPVKRREKVFIRGWDLDGKEMNFEVSGFQSRVYQHEIDHLRGILIIHYVSRIKRDLMVKRMIKNLKHPQKESSMR